MKVLPGPRSQLLGFRLSRELDCELVVPEVEKFPDGELLVNVGEDPGDRVAVVQSTRTNEDLVTLLLLVDAARRAGAGVAAVAPYLGYARQDEVFRPGQPLSLAAVVGAINAQGAPLVTVEPHSDPSPHGDVSPVAGAPAVADMVEDWGAELVLAPDEGAREEAAEVAELVGAEHDHLVKKRFSGDEVSLETKELSAEGKDVVIVDDVIATGGTMTEAASMLKDEGAGSVSAAATHGVLVGSAVSKLLSSGVERIAVTDTLETGLSEGSVAGVLAEELR